MKTGEGELKLKSEEDDVQTDSKDSKDSKGFKRPRGTYWVPIGSHDGQYVSLHMTYGLLRKRNMVAIEEVRMIGYTDFGQRSSRKAVVATYSTSNESMRGGIERYTDSAERGRIVV
jgi:hypothetical protein